MIKIAPKRSNLIESTIFKEWNFINALKKFTDIQNKINEK